MLEHLKEVCPLDRIERLGDVQLKEEARSVSAVKSLYGVLDEEEIRCNVF